MKTRTGNFPIGLRRGGSDWQKDLKGLLKWANNNGIEALDLGRDGNETGKAVLDAGLRIGSIDLSVWQPMISADKGKRQKAIDANSEYIRACAPLGQVNYFLVMLPEKPELPRAENFGYMVESFAQLAPVLEAHNARLVIEGWPGPGALCCTPESVRALIREVPSKSIGLNFDGSHLLRMGIDPLRFLAEFGERVYHVHGKDTELLTDNIYEFGNEQAPTFAKPVAFGAMHWRYTIPGHGIIRWNEVTKSLVDLNYTGCISIELEDCHFNGSQEGEQAGILHGARFLTGV